MVFGHAVLLLLLGRQIQHFGYGLEGRLAIRVKAFREVWLHINPGEV